MDSNSLLQTVLAQINSQQATLDSVLSPTSSVSQSNRTSTDTVVIKASPKPLDTHEEGEEDYNDTSDISINIGDTPSSLKKPFPTLSHIDTSSDSISDPHDSKHKSYSPSIATSLSSFSPSNRKSTDSDLPSHNDRSLSDGVAIQLNDRGLSVLPADLIPAMQNSVSKLSLQANNLTFLPKQVNQMKFLTYLDLSHNTFVEFPSVVSIVHLSGSLTMSNMV